MTEDLVRVRQRSSWAGTSRRCSISTCGTRICPRWSCRFSEADGTVSYRWKADEPAFAMPVRIGSPGAWRIIEPTTTWATMKDVDSARERPGRDRPLLRQRRGDAKTGNVRNDGRDADRKIVCVAF